jgi:hypothetical protein
MKIVLKMTAALLALVERPAQIRERGTDRGDVPGWVMVTVMTAILVVAILGIFEPQIKSALSGIIDTVSGNN